MVATIKLELNLDTLIKAVNSLNWEEKHKLWSILNEQMEGVKVEDRDEIISIQEIVESEKAWDDYINGKDKGISSQDLKTRLLGKDRE